MIGAEPTRRKCFIPGNDTWPLSAPAAPLRRLANSNGWTIISRGLSPRVSVSFLSNIKLQSSAKPKVRCLNKKQGVCQLTSVQAQRAFQARLRSLGFCEVSQSDLKKNKKFKDIQIPRFYFYPRQGRALTPRRRPHPGFQPHCLQVGCGWCLFLSPQAGLKNSPARVACLLRQKTDLKARCRGSAEKIRAWFVFFVSWPSLFRRASCPAET